MTTPAPKMRNSLRSSATRWLLLATVCWGLSFPIMRTLNLAQAEWMPGRATSFFAALGVSSRFALATAVMLLLCLRSVRHLSRNEVWHGLGLGAFGGVGLLLQVDGLAHTDASTSAFLTQAYCLLLPVLVALRDRHWPPVRVLLGCVLVVIGAAVLAGLSPGKLGLGRGEAETLLASVLFALQILWLERPRFAECQTNHSSLVMFATVAIVALPVAVATTKESSDWLHPFRYPATWGLLGLLVVFCTLMAFGLMNRWQRHVGATIAGLIYCVEPVCASLFALFLPAWFGAWTGVAYPNETITLRLVIGGGLILAANVLAQWPEPSENSPNSGLPKS